MHAKMRSVIYYPENRQSYNTIERIYIDRINKIIKFFLEDLKKSLLQVTNIFVLEICYTDG